MPRHIRAGDYFHVIYIYTFTGELKGSDPFVKAEAVRKLTYLNTIGYDISWAAFSIVEVMSMPRLVVKPHS